MYFEALMISFRKIGWCCDKNKQTNMESETKKPEILWLWQLTEKEELYLFTHFKGLLIPFL